MSRMILFINVYNIILNSQIVSYNSIYNSVDIGMISSGIKKTKRISGKQRALCSGWYINCRFLLKEI